ERHRLQKGLRRKAGPAREQFLQAGRRLPDFVSEFLQRMLVAIVEADLLAHPADDFIVAPLRRDVALEDGCWLQGRMCVHLEISLAAISGFRAGRATRFLHRRTAFMPGFACAGIAWLDYPEASSFRIASGELPEKDSTSAESSGSSIRAAASLGESHALPRVSASSHSSSVLRTASRKTFTFTFTKLSESRFQ